MLLFQTAAKFSPDIISPDGCGIIFMAKPEPYAVPLRPTNLNASMWVLFALPVTMELLMTMKEFGVDYSQGKSTLNFPHQGGFHIFSPDYIKDFRLSSVLKVLIHRRHQAARLAIIPPW